jgi:succinate dehydrogenase / fumarate reductase, cytochrome b subunit
LLRTRPIYLNLFLFHFPVTAVVSFLHRLSGVFLVFLIPLLLWALHVSLESEQSFDALKSSLSAPWIKIIFWLLYSAIFYHLIAGIRHLLMDIHLGESKKIARFSSFLVLFISFFGILLGGYWICCG